MSGRSPLRGSGLRPDGPSQSALSQAKPLVPNAAFLLKSWDVTVEGYGAERIVAASRGKALAKAWRCDAFNRLPFGDFLKIATAWRAMLVPEDFGRPILVQGRPAFNVGRHYSYVTFAWPWTETVLNSHPSDVTALAGEAATAVETPKSGSIHEHATVQPERPNPTPILPKKERTK